MAFDLNRRSAETELMDAEDVSYEEFRDCLHDLARVNVLSLGYRPTLAFLDRLRTEGRLDLGRPVQILDVGSGYGDLLRQVDAWASRHKIPVMLTGLDLNPWSARAATEVTASGRPIRWETKDLFEPRGRGDVILSSLFAHHLDDSGVINFLRWMEDRARIGWFVNDLHRHRLPASMFGPLARVLHLHRFVCHDGPVSFRRSFLPSDWRRYLTEAAVSEDRSRIFRTFPFRLCVSRIMPA
jgi:hypothetical protein